MSTLCYSMVRGSVARFTRLNPRGAPLEGPESTIVTNGIVKIGVSEVTDSEPTEALRGSTDDIRMIFRGHDETLRYDLDFDLVGVYPSLVSFLTGHPGVRNAAGAVVGLDVDPRATVPDFAVEVWTRLAPRTVGGYSYGYNIFPRVGGGRFQGLGVKNGTAPLRIVGARTKRMSQWGVGPYRLSQFSGGFGTLPFGTGPFGGVPFTQGPCQETAEGFSRQPSMIRGNTQWRTFLLDTAPKPTKGPVSLRDAIEGGNATYTSPDVLDGQFAVTSEDRIDGGFA